MYWLAWLVEPCLEAEYPDSGWSLVDGDRVSLERLWGEADGPSLFSSRRRMFLVLVGVRLTGGVAL